MEWARGVAQEGRCCRPKRMAWLMEGEGNQLSAWMEESM